MLVTFFSSWGGWSAERAGVDWSWWPLDGAERCRRSGMRPAYSALACVTSSTHSLVSCEAIFARKENSRGCSEWNYSSSTGDFETGEEQKRVKDERPEIG